MGRMDGRVAIITGASRGLGKDVAVALAREGAAVVIAARTEREGESRIPGSMAQTVRLVQEVGGRALAIRCDVTSEEDIAATVQQTLDTFGRLDILVNNAAVNVPGTLRDMQVRHWHLAFRVNVTGPFLFCRAALPAMIQGGWGHIINVSSGAAIGPGTGPYAQVSRGGLTYGTTKKALERMSQGLAAEVWQDHISVNVLSPHRGIKTEGTAYFYELSGPRDWSAWRKSGAIFGDAVVAICSQEPGVYTGHLLRDELVMTELAGLSQEEVLRRYPI